MKPVTQVFQKLVTFNCLTNDLPMHMLLGKQSFRLFCLQEWDDVAGSGDTHYTGRASLQVIV